VNFTPPIRGGTFRTQSEAIAPIDHATGLDVSLAAPYALTRVRTNDSTDTDASSVDDYISRAVQGEINSDMKDFPSLDMQTQREINLKYRALHDRVAREGFYQCRYSEYGKEAIRYTTLFALFLLTLRSGWYITSAAFLGLFWVGVSVLSLISLTPTAPDHVYGARRRSPRHYSPFCYRHAGGIVHCGLLLRLVHWLVEKQPQRPSSRHEPSRKIPTCQRTPLTV
jgi:hypothetical protein